MKLTSSLRSMQYQTSDRANLPHPGFTLNKNMPNDGDLKSLVHALLHPDLTHTTKDFKITVEISNGCFFANKYIFSIGKQQYSVRVDRFRQLVHSDNYFQLRQTMLNNTLKQIDFIDPQGVSRLSFKIDYLGIASPHVSIIEYRNAQNSNQLQRFENGQLIPRNFILLDTHGRVVYEGNIDPIMGIPYNGRGSFSMNGTIFSGEFDEDGVCDGTYQKGSSTYSGEINILTGGGTGSIEYVNLDDAYKFSGSWDENGIAISGTGKFYSNGWVFTFENDKVVKAQKNGYEYSGEFSLVDGCGTGCIKSPNGSVIKCNWDKDGLPVDETTDNYEDSGFQCNELLFFNFRNGIPTICRDGETTYSANMGFPNYASGDFELSTLDGMITSTVPETNTRVIYSGSYSYGVPLDGVGQFVVNNHVIDGTYKNGTFSCDQVINGYRYNGIVSAKDGYFHGRVTSPSSNSVICGCMRFKYYKKDKPTGEAGTVLFMPTWQNDNMILQYGQFDANGKLVPLTLNTEYSPERIEGWLTTRYPEWSIKDNISKRVILISKSELQQFFSNYASDYRLTFMGICNENLRPFNGNGAFVIGTDLVTHNNNKLPAGCYYGEWHENSFTGYNLTTGEYYPNLDMSIQTTTASLQPY